MQTRIPLAVTKIPARTKAEAYRWVYAHFSTGMHVVQCVHDDDCKAIGSARDTDCSPDCRPDWYLLTLVDGHVRNNR